MKNMPLSLNLSGKALLLTIFVISCALFLTFSIFLYQGYTYARHTNESVIRHFEQLREAREILTDLLNMETGVRGYLLIGQPQFLQPYHESRTWLGNEVSNLKKSVKNEEPKIQNATNAIFFQAHQFDSLLADEIQFAQQPVKLAALKRTIKKQKESMDHLRQSFEDFTQNSQSILNDQLAQLKGKQRNFMILLFSGTLGMIGIMALATYTILSLTKRNRESIEAMRASEHRLRTVMNGINDGLFDYHVANNTLYFSPTYKKMLGFEDHEFPDTLETFNASLHPEDIDQVWAVIGQYQRHEIQTYINYFRMRHKLGGWRWVMSLNWHPHRHHRSKET